MKAKEIRKLIKRANEALKYAIVSKDYAEVQSLIERGADVNAKSEKGRTPLMMAAMFGHKDIVKALIEAGAKVSEREEGGYTAYLWASEGGYTEIMRLLEREERRQAKIAEDKQDQKQN